MKRLSRAVGFHCALEPLEPRRLLSSYLVTNLNDSGSGSLRAAIGEANATSDADTISFSAGLHGTIVLGGTALVISAPVQISGPGTDLVTVSGNRSSRVFEVQVGSGQVSISGLTITQGQAPQSMGGGAIWNAAFLTLSDDVISDSAAGDGIADPPSGGPLIATPGGNGGGIYSTAPLTVDSCTVSGNRAGTGGASAYPDQGKVGGSGGGIWAAHNTVIRNSTLNDNEAGTGGKCLTPNSPPSGWGGNGGAFASGSSAPQFTFINSTIANNRAGQAGDSPQGLAGSGGAGGGVYADGRLTFTNVTISGNVAGAAAAVSRGSEDPGICGGVFVPQSGFPYFANSIIAGNMQSLLANPYGPDVFGGIHSSGYNLVGIGYGSSGWVRSDQLGGISFPLDPRLSPLADHGGPTQTLALLPGSPAIDAGFNQLARDADGTPLLTDQRHLARIFGGTTDIGAFEAQPPALVGDVNHDGTVNFSDLLITAQDYGSTSQPLWEGGDLTGDGTVGFSDLLLLAQNYGHASAASAPAAETIEPVSLLVRSRARPHKA